MAANSNQPANFPDMINKIEAQLEALGSGPHTDSQKEKIKALNIMLVKARQENQKTPMPPGSTPTYQQPAPAPKPTQPTAPSVIAVDPSKMDTGGAGASSSLSTHKILDKKRLQDLVKEIDPMAQLEDDVEEVLMQIADDFIENVVNSSCDIAKHRHSDTLEVKDVQLYLDRAWNMWVPGFGTDEIKPYKRAPVTEAHKQRLALIKKTLKKS